MAVTLIQLVVRCSPLSRTAMQIRPVIQNMSCYLSLPPSASLVHAARVSGAEPPRWWVASPSVSVGLPLGMGEVLLPAPRKPSRASTTGSMHSTDVTGNEGARVAESWSPRPAQDYCTGGGGVQRGLLPCYSAPHSTAQ